MDRVRLALIVICAGGTDAFMPTREFRMAATVDDVRAMCDASCVKRRIQAPCQRRQHSSTSMNTRNHTAVSASLVPLEAFERFDSKVASAASFPFLPDMLSIKCIPTPSDHPTTARCSAPCFTWSGRIENILFAKSELVSIAAVRDASGRAVKDFRWGARRE